MWHYSHRYRIYLQGVESFSFLSFFSSHVHKTVKALLRYLSFLFSEGQNESDIGDAVRNALAHGLITRDQLYITSKISPYELGTQKAQEACSSILQRLGLDYIDLLLIHWPGAAKTPLSSAENSIKRRETWRVLERQVESGTVKAIGVSNYEIHHLEDLFTYAKFVPAVNQIECHPLWPQQELRQYCKDRGIHIVAYSSFGSGALLQCSEVQNIATSSNKTAAQMLLCWGLQKGCAVLPKSNRPERIREYSPLLAPMQPDPTGRFISSESESALDRLGLSSNTRRKFCWDSREVA